MVELLWAWSGWEKLLCHSPSVEAALEEAGWGSQGVGEDFQLLGAAFLASCSSCHSSIQPCTTEDSWHVLAAFILENAGMKHLGL